MIQIPFNLVDHPPLVVIFEDFEGFSPAVVQNFLSICRYHLKWLITFWSVLIVYIIIVWEFFVVLKTKNKDCAAQSLNIFKDVCMLWGTNLAPTIQMSVKFSDYGEL